MVFYPVYNGAKDTGTLVNVTNITDSTVYYYTDMSFFEALSFQGSLSCVAGTVTLTVEGTLQDDDTAAASCTYADITNAVFGVASVVATAGDATVSLFDTNKLLGGFKYVRVKIVYNTTANTGDALIYFIRTRGI